MLWRRLHDLLPRMVDRQPESRRKQFHVPLGIPSVLQHALGIPTPIRPLGFVRRYQECVHGAKRGSGCEGTIAKEGRAREGKCWQQEEEMSNRWTTDDENGANICYTPDTFNKTYN